MSSVKPRFAGLMLLVSAGLFSPSAWAHGSEDREIVTGKAELASLVHQNRGMYPAIQASTRLTREGRSIGSLPDRIEDSIAIVADGVCQREMRWYKAGELAKPSPECSTTRYAEDGVNVAYIRMDDAWASVGPAGSIRGGVSTARSCELLWTMRWLPTSGSSVEAQSGDLESLLNSPYTSVGALAEDVDGASCAVLDVHSPKGLLLERLWLDPAVGYLPRMQRSYEIDGVVTLERHVYEFVEIRGGGFLPRLATVWAKSDLLETIPEDSLCRLELIESERWVWPTVVGAAPNASFTSVTEVIPAGFVVE